ncbi:MAG: hypothetical protein LKF71_02615 [Oscillospiraceae bacterium]|jgi:hypothetical protein|nr:hypothetical protein [Oscillospiraceae bacterium]
MSYYTERHGLRAPIENTYDITVAMYALIIDCCQKYYKNLTHLFPLKCHDDFTASDYLSFDEHAFQNRINSKIPTLFRDKNGKIGVPEDGDKYDQYALLDFIEFIAQNIKDISEGWNNPRYQNYWNIDCLNTWEIFSKYQNEINGIYKESGLLYTLTSERIVERIVENSSLTSENEKNISAVKEKGTRELLTEAVILYKQPYSESQRDAVEKIWDAFERLKTYYTTLDKKHSAAKIVNDMAHGTTKFTDLFNAEFKALTDIGNTFRIRHHETDKIDITDTKYFDYFFNRCLSLIALAIQYLQ